MTRPAIAATAIAAADKADPELAADVVRAALARAGSDIAGSVLLFLSSDFVHHAHAAVAAAARAAHCLQVTGCTAPGVFTEDDWVLDRPAVAAMVFGAGVGLSAHATADRPLLSLATPGAAAAGWLGAGAPRYGLLSTGASAQGSGRVWCHAKPDIAGRCETAVAGAREAVGVSHGVRLLTAPLGVEAVDGYELRKLGGHDALTSLQRALPAELRAAEKPPLHLLAVAMLEGDAQDAARDGRFTLVPLLGISHEERSVALAGRVEPGTQLAWALRQPEAAEADMRRVAERLAGELDAPPDFGLLFSCLGRGPYFFGGEDRDLSAVVQRFPALPLIGAYGGGQIAPQPGGGRVVHNTAVLALFRADVQP